MTMAGRRSRKSPRRAPAFVSRRATLWTLASGGLIVLCIGALFGYQAVKARSALQLAATQAQQLQSQVSAGDVKTARTTLSKLESSTGNAESHTSGVLWNAGAHAPFFGHNVEAVQTISRVLHELSRTGLKPIVDAADSIDTQAFSPSDGKVDVKAIADIAPALSVADRSLTSGMRQLEDVNAADLIGPLQGPVSDLKSKLAKAQRAASSGATAAKVMPTMLGATGSRSYLLVFQNLAESRSTGGIAGAYAVVKAEDGKVSLSKQGTGSSFGYFDQPVVSLTKDEKNLYSNLMASYWADANFTPDFARSGEIYRAMYAERSDQEVDGVISVDPVALSYILKATGPIKLGNDAELTSKNAVEVLLNKIYLATGDNLSQDTFFADAASRVFDAVSSGKADPQTLLSALVKSSRENRVLVWSHDKTEQAVLSDTRVGGTLASDSGATPHVGIYLNDATATKLEYYLDHKSSMHTDVCSSGDVQTIQTTTVLRSTVPKGGKGLPDSVTGPSKDGKQGIMRLNVRVYAPYGGRIDEVTVNDDPQTIQSARHERRNVTVVPVRLEPGQTVTVRTDLVTGKGQPDDPILTTTPTVNPTRNNVAVASACRR
ncbi:DUF4012 domain-containing protein [Aeromicrobium sp.]|uniref:DUF4012 domain-containing protein n=1 Tax=Aeromicrobium sp. TaxID=1871063 RepID=UPI0019AD7669|nr:DUF4012 domain-containing protein [Aeromicrobium sp.]MBC7630477.1 DUF4012 domain-containing protein [Aeromicrobium sp.]